MARRKPEEEMIRLETEVRAPLDVVWRAWTTAEGFRAFHPPGADIDLRIGGVYDVALPERPDERGRVLGFLPHELLSVEWTTLARGGRRELGSRLVILFQRRSSGRVRLRLAHFRLGNRGDWDRTAARLGETWRTLLASFEAFCARRPVRPYSRPEVIA